LNVNANVIIIVNIYTISILKGNYTMTFYLKFKHIIFNLLNIKTIVLFIIFFIPSSLLSKDTITWYYPNFPPTNIVEGPYKGQGLLGSIYKQVFNHLDNYTHEKSIANFKRLIKNIKLETQSCGVALLWNKDREKVVEYSIAYFLVHPVRIIINKKDFMKFLPYIQNDGTYSFNAILKDEKLYLGYSNGRSYSKILDDSIKELTTDKNSILSTQSFILGGLLKMLTRDRIDYTLGYAHEMNFVSKSLNLDNKFMSLTIYESNDLIPVYVGCPKNKWGKKIIKKLNPFLLKYRDSNLFYSSYLRWLDKEAAKNYPKLVEQYFRM